MSAVFYLAVKLLAYSAWCYFGLRWIRGDRQPSFFRGIAYGLLRLFMGFFFAVLIFLFSSSILCLG